jgi:hypothetical protein
MVQKSLRTCQIHSNKEHDRVHLCFKIISFQNVHHYSNYTLLHNYKYVQCIRSLFKIFSPMSSKLFPTAVFVLVLISLLLTRETYGLLILIFLFPFSFFIILVFFYFIFWFIILFMFSTVLFHSC